MMRFLAGGLACIAAWTTMAQEPLLPDLAFDASVSPPGQFDTTARPGRLLFRFDSSIPNLGDGPFLLRANGVDAGSGREFVNQVIENSDDTETVRDAGEFVYNTDDFHMECFDWVAYRIREILPDDGVGQILRSGQKESVRITSSIAYQGGPPQGRRIFADLEGNHGIGVGYTDIYSAGLEFQWIDITGLPKGEYWLEQVVDPRDYILEKDETNNADIVKVTLEHPNQPDAPVHRADTGNFGVLDLDELLRVIQLYNAGAHQCAENTEDGYKVGAEDQDCQPHSTDFEDADFSLNLSELLRTIQIFAIGGYSSCESSGDGFCLVSP